MDSDLGGGLFCRLLHDDLQVGDLERIARWELSQSFEQFYFDNVQKIDKEIEGLKKFQLMEDPERVLEPPTIHEKLLKKISKKQKWSMKILMGMVFKNIKVIEDLAKQGKEWKLLVDEKNLEIAVLQRESEVRGKQLAEESTVTEELETTFSSLTERLKDKENEIAALLRKANFHAKQVVLKSTALTALSITVGNVRDRLREAEDDRAKKLAEKDLKINHMLAEKDQLIEAHRIECTALRSKAERLEAKFEHFVRAVRTFGQHCVIFRTELEEMESNHNPLEKELSITCLKSANQDTECQQAKRRRAVEEESIPGPSKRQQMRSKKVKAEKGN